jgi:hypothetical protein
MYGSKHDVSMGPQVTTQILAYKTLNQGPGVTIFFCHPFKLPITEAAHGPFLGAREGRDPEFLHGPGSPVVFRGSERP